MDKSRIIIPFGIQHGTWLFGLRLNVGQLTFQANIRSAAALLHKLHKLQARITALVLL